LTGKLTDEVGDGEKGEKGPGFVRESFVGAKEK